MNSRCPKCGLNFTTPIAKSSSGLAHIEFYGSRVICPRCGSDVPIQDGRYSVDENGLFRLLSDPNIPKEALSSLKDLAQKAQEEQYSKGQFIEEAEQIHPIFKFLRDWVIPKDQTAFFAMLAILVPLIVQILSSEEKPTTTIINNNTTNIYQTMPTGLSPTITKLPDLRKNSHLTPPKKKRRNRK